MGEYISCIYTKALADGETIDMFYFFFLIFFFFGFMPPLYFTQRKWERQHEKKKNRLGMQNFRIECMPNNFC